MTATAGFALVLGAGGVAAASEHAAHPRAVPSATTTSTVEVEHHQRGKGPGSPREHEATTTTLAAVPAPTMPTTVVQNPTQTTVEPGDVGDDRGHDVVDNDAHETSTTVAGVTPTTPEPRDIGDDRGDDRGDDNRGHDGVDNDRDDAVDHSGPGRDGSGGGGGHDGRG